MTSIGPLNMNFPVKKILDSNNVCFENAYIIYIKLFIFKRMLICAFLCKFFSNYFSIHDLYYKLGIDRHKNPMLN